MANDSDIRADLVVIGGGPGGYAAAFHAADLGMDVAMVDADPQPGGVCLHRGCIPSKALLHVAKLINESQDAAEWGISFQKPKIDLDKLRSWKEGVVGKLAGGVAQLCKARNVNLIRAKASFVDSKTLSLTGDNGGQPQTLRFSNAILATGSSPVMPPVFDIGDDRVMDSTGGLALADVPEKLLVIGGGYIGLEMGTVYAALGSQVTVVELTGGLLPGADRDLVRPLKARLSKTLAAIHLDTKVDKLKAGKAGITATLVGSGDPAEETFDRVLVSVGRRPNSAGIGLENTQVEVSERGFVQVDSKQQTADPHILAIGDVVGEPMLAHKASREGKVAVEVLAGQPAEFDNVAIPAVVFTDPEIAWCGLTETQAKAEGRKIKVARFPWGASGRAMTLDRTEGSTKLIFDPDSQRLLGVGIVGPGAGELIAEGVLGVEMGSVARDMADSIHPHPTTSETLMESAELFLGHATHVYRPKK